MFLAEAVSVEKLIQHIVYNNVFYLH
jgi:hypothetical protein